MEEMLKILWDNKQVKELNKDKGKKKEKDKWWKMQETKWKNINPLKKMKLENKLKNSNQFQVLKLTIIQFTKLSKMILPMKILIIS